MPFKTSKEFIGVGTE